MLEIILWIYQQGGIVLKKLLCGFLCLTLLTAVLPISASAAAAAQIIDMHGAKTYIGLASDWSAQWNESKFDDITNKDVSCDGDVTIKSGTVKNVDAPAAVTMTGGTVSSINADGNITINGGTVKHNIDCGGTVTFNDKMTSDGTCTAVNITATASDTTTIGALQATGTITLGGTGIKTKEIDGQNRATLKLSNYTLQLPKITDMGTFEVSQDCTAAGEVTAETINIADKKELTAKSTVEVDTLNGPGSLGVSSGKLLIHRGATNKPLLRFTNTVGNGSLAFKADHNTVSAEDVKVYDYTLESTSSSDYDNFRLVASIKEGVSLSESSVSVGTKPVIIKAYVNPSLSKFAQGTKIVWELHGDTASFSKSEDTTNNTCTITRSGSTTASAQATLLAYLVDGHGDRLTDYKSDSCVLNIGSSQNNSSGSTDIVLDTTNVTIPRGGTYWVLAATASSTPPVQLSYNSSVAVVGKASSYSGNGKTGWLYPVTGVAKGAVTIDIGGQKMITNVAGGSITVDTSSFTMSPGAKYCIGVRIQGLDRKRLNVHSANGCTTIQYGGCKNGLDLYTVKAEQQGTGYAIFDVVGGTSVSTRIDVIPGAAPQGVSARLIATD